MNTGHVDFGLARIEFVLDFSTLLGNGVEALHAHGSESRGRVWMSDPVTQDGIVTKIGSGSEDEERRDTASRDFNSASHWTCARGRLAASDSSLITRHPAQERFCLGDNRITILLQVVNGGHDGIVRHDARAFEPAALR